MYTCLLFQNNLGVNAKVKKPKRTPIEWLKKYFLEGKEVCTSFMNITTRQTKSKELVMSNYYREGRSAYSTKQTLTGSVHPYV